MVDGFVRGGRLVYTLPPVATIRSRTLAQQLRLAPAIRVLSGPARYPVGLEVGLHARKTALIEAAREPALALAH